MTASRDQIGTARQPAVQNPFVKPPPSVLLRLSAEDRDRLDLIHSEPVDYVHHDSFSKSSTARALFADAIDGKWSTQPWCNSSKVRPRITDSVCGPRMTLTGEQERLLFLRWNYARFRMAKLLLKHAGRRLTAKATIELLWWHARATATRAEIVRTNLPLVLAMAKRTRLGTTDYAELISEGNMALLRSVNKFDCGRGFKFSTYACRAILKSFSRVAMKASRYRGRFPLEFDPSLEKSTYTEQRRAEHEADCVDELRCIIKKNSAALNEVEVKVIQARFALGKKDDIEADGPKTLQQVGLLIGVTKERVRQIQNRALEKLRVKLQDDFLAA